MKVRIKKLNENATIPTYGTDYAAGADLYAGHLPHAHPGLSLRLYVRLALGPGGRVHRPAAQVFPVRDARPDARRRRDGF